MHSLDACRAQILLQPQIKVRRIYANKYIRAILQQACAQLLADGQDIPQPYQHFKAVPMHGQPLAGPQRFKTTLLHAGPTNAIAGDAGPLLLHAVQKQTGEQVT